MVKYISGWYQATVSGSNEIITYKHAVFIGCGEKQNKTLSDICTKK